MRNQKLLLMAGFLLVTLNIVSCSNKEEFIASKGNQDVSVSPLATTSTQVCAQSTLVSPKVDVLLLWDNSSSALFINSSTKSSFNQLITSVSEKFDYHILSAPLISNNSNTLNEASLVVKDSSSVSGTASGIVKTKDAAASSLGFSTASGSVEPGVDRATSIIQANRSNGIFRNDAYTIIVVMSNGDDTSCEAETGIAGGCPDNGDQGWVPKMQTKINKLLCLRGNVGTGIDCSATTPLNSTMMRFINISSLTTCSFGKINSRYRKVAKAIYESSYSNGWPTSNDNLNPFTAGGVSYPDNYDICSIDFNHIFDGVNSAIKQTLIKHVYEYWPVAASGVSVDPDTLRVVRDDGKVLVNKTGQSSPGDGFGYIGNQTNHNTRSYPTAGENFTGQMIQLFGVNDNDKIVYPHCLTVTYDAQKLKYGYIYLKNGAPYEETIEVRINGVAVPKSASNGWDYMGLQIFNGNSSMDLANYKVVDLPSGAPSGYIIRLNGSYQFSNTAGAAVNVIVNYTSKQ